jgi:activator of HSP90 ATPase
LETVPTPAPVPAAAAGASVWNQAGTWEEKDLTKWAKTTLQEQIENTKYILPASSPAPGAEVVVTKVKTLDGHASCAVARGKKRYIYEFMVKLEWKLSSSGSDLECTGSLAIPDIDGTIDLGDGYEIHEFAVDSVSDNSLRPLIDRFVHRGGFHDALNASIDDWVRKFKSEY